MGVGLVERLSGAYGALGRFTTLRESGDELEWKTSLKKEIVRISIASPSRFPAPDPERHVFSSPFRGREVTSLAGRQAAGKGEGRGERPARLVPACLAVSLLLSLLRKRRELEPGAPSGHLASFQTCDIEEGKSAHHLCTPIN